MEVIYDDIRINSSGGTNWVNGGGNYENPLWLTLLSVLL